MKNIFMWLCCLVAFGAAAQTKVTRSYPVKQGQQIKLDFDYPKIVKVSTWDKNEVSVTAFVTINGGDNDDAFTLEQTSDNDIITIKNKIVDMDKLPHTYTIMRDGTKTMFKTKEAFQEYKNKNGQFTYSSNGVDMEITIEVKVPANTNTNVVAKYGIVELVDFNGPVNVNATYGGIDATVNESKTGKLTATTSYGQILTNLDLKITDKTEKDFFTSFTAEPGKGPTYVFKSTYGKIYLRKP